MTVALGGEYARVRTDPCPGGPGGDSELLAAYFGAGDQMHDLRTVQLHAAPRTRLQPLFKGAVANSAHSVYSGLIRVEKGAKGTNAFQTNRNLVLSEGAQADSVPNLEIEDNDVRCSHASAVGPIDESQLFYLESRGVPTASAELVDRPRVPGRRAGAFPARGMRAGLRQAVAAKLSSVGLGPDGRVGMSTEIRVKLADVPDGEAVRVEGGSYGVCIVRLGDEVYALADRCSHQNWLPVRRRSRLLHLHDRMHQARQHVFVEGRGPQCLPATQPVDVFPARVEGDEVVVSTAMSELVIEDLHAPRRGEANPARDQPEGGQRRGPRRHGPERFGKIDAFPRDCRPPGL